MNGNISHKANKLLSILKRYGLKGSLNLFTDVVITTIFYPGARLIRRPVDIRGKRFIKIGKGFTTGKYCRIEAYNDSKSRDYMIILGNGVQLNDNVHLVASEYLEIGNNVLIASKVFISDTSHGNYNLMNQSNPDTPPSSRNNHTKPVFIGDNVWIGENSIILPGVRIESGAIVGAGSVVTKNVPENCIVAGNPARTIKTYNLNSKQWEKTY